MISKNRYMQLLDNISSIKNNVNCSQKYNSDFNIMMASISTSLSPNTFRDDVISIVNADLPKEGNKGHQAKNIVASQMNARHHAVTPESLASKWNIGLERSKQTIKVTDAIKLEMVSVRPAFKKWENRDVNEALNRNKLVGYQWITCHLICYIKMDGKFTRKARFVAEGHTTNSSSSTTYSSVISRDSVRIAFLITVLNASDIISCDIGNV